MQTIAGIAIPDSALAREATDLVRSHETDLLFHHSLRVYYFGALKGRHRGLQYNAELLYLGAMFHDLGLTPAYSSATERFEVDGANAARDFMQRHGIPNQDIDLVWDAIALHTTPGIPKFKKPEVALVTAGVETDVLGLDLDEISRADRDPVVTHYPRVQFKEGIIQAFSQGIKHKPETTFGNVKADVLELTLPGYQRVNFCRLIHDSPWTD
ncbi:HD domain-containing protein [Deinococcus sp. Leaf326]|uniref:HD domain-containing protein n=1 Tax=Deinococcus sp. Leaf326 TaxID=1736338 RepID=UPI00070078BD|nr:HD domain-containing protein [Deinococcus sp. Leaf326]KQR25527.1 phosphohydrolase [Deinococcus sp. Leaf326]